MGERKAPDWESKLWGYLSSGDGEHCPLLSHCHARQRRGWCPVDHKIQIDRALDYKRFKITDYNFVKFWTPCEIFKQVEMLAQKWLEKGRVHCPPVPAELVRLADDKHPIEVRQPPLKVYHGGIWHLGDRWVIQLKSDDPPATKRFTLFHEAFHISAHCKSVPVFSKRGTSEGGFNEMLADSFAAYILMPKQWVKEKWAEVNDLDRMAKIFQVPKSTMCIRLKVLGLIF